MQVFLALAGSVILASLPVGNSFVNSLPQLPLPFSQLLQQQPVMMNVHGIFCLSVEDIEAINNFIVATNAKNEDDVVEMYNNGDERCYVADGNIPVPTYVKDFSRDDGLLMHIVTFTFSDTVRGDMVLFGAAPQQGNGL